MPESNLEYENIKTNFLLLSSKTSTRDTLLRGTIPLCNFCFALEFFPYKALLCILHIWDQSVQSSFTSIIP